MNENLKRCPVCGVEGTYERHGDGWATCSRCGMEANSVAADALEEMNTREERTSIVRCRDCKHMHTVRHWLGMDVYECWLHADPESGALGKEPTEPDGFCAWGEKELS